MKNKFFLKEILFNFFSADAKIFEKKPFCPPKVKIKHPKKFLGNTQNLIFLTALSCPNGPNKRIHVQNVACRPTVYKTGRSMHQL